MAFYGRWLRKLMVTAGSVAVLLVLSCAQSPAPTATPAATPAKAPTPVTTPGATLKPAGDAAAGEKVFLAQGCGACHQAKGAGGSVGPNLDGVWGSRVKLAGGQEVTANEDYIRESIVNPTAKIVAGSQPIMPPSFATLPAQDLNNLIAFIASLAK